MTTEQFIKAVAEMRRLQKLYFKGRNITVLKASKNAEKEVDTEVFRLLGIGPDGQPVGPSLFDAQPQEGGAQHG